MTGPVNRMASRPGRAAISTRSGRSRKVRAGSVRSQTGPADPVGNTSSRRNLAVPADLAPIRPSAATEAVSSAGVSRAR